MHAFYSRAFNPGIGGALNLGTPPSSASWTSPGRARAVTCGFLLGVGSWTFRLCHLPEDRALRHRRLWSAPPYQQVGRTVLDIHRALSVWFGLGPRSETRFHAHQLAHLLVNIRNPRIPASQTRVETGSLSGCSTVDANVDSGESVNPSGLEAAVINTRIGALAGKRGVHRILPAWSQPGHRICCATSLASNRVEPLSLFAEHAVGVDRACGQEQVRVKISIIAITGRHVQGAVHTDPKLLGDFLGEAESQRGPFVGIKLAGKREHNFSRKHRVTSTMVYLDAVPELFTIPHEPTARQMDTRIENAFSAAVVEDLPSTLITDQRTCTVCSGGCRGATAGSSDGSACAQVKNGHTKSVGVSGRSPDRT